MQHIPGEAAAHTFAWRNIVGQRDELFRLFRALRNRRWLIFLITAILTSAAIAVVLQVKPRYAATAKLLLDPQSPHMGRSSETPVLPGLLVDREAIESEMQIINSRKLATRVVEKLDLLSDPEFNEQRAPKTGIDAALGWLDALRSEIKRLILDEDQPIPGIDEDMVEKAKVIDAFQDKVQIYREGQSRVIGVSVVTKNPARSAQVANTLSDLYLLDHLENQFAQRKRMAQWLDERLTEIKLAANASQQAVENYRRQAGLFETKDEAGRTQRIDTQQLTQLSTQLITARSDRAALEARLRTVERLGKAGQDLASVPEVIANPVIASLRSQEAKVLQRTADLSTDFGPRHPSMISAKSELEDIRSNIQREIARVISSVQNEVSRARGRESALQDAYKELEGKTAQANDRYIRLAELARESDVNQQVLEQFLQQFKQVSATQALAEPEARIIAYAEPPVVRAYPKRALTIALALLGSLLLASAVALLLERTNATFRTAEDIEDGTGLPLLTVVPRILGSGWLKRGRGLSRQALDDPSTNLTEALHGLSVRLVSRGFAAPKNRLLITSSFPGEGKSTIAISLARVLASQGHKVVLVDADFRRPQITTTLALIGKAGIADVLADRAELDDVIYDDPASPVRVVPPGREARSAEMLNYEGLANLLRRLSQANDFVIIDSAPVLVVPDALMLCRSADHTILAVRWNRTNREDTLRAINQLQSVGASLAGVVLNAVEMSKYAGYAYRDAKGYLRAYARYYG